jgi:predicted RNA-binding Zn-ribbon protein involved in translation (DUF1610 family)
MGLVLPDDMDKLVYFTRRKIENGAVIAWVDKLTCPKCGKGIMSKPKDAKTGRPKIRATEYVCEACGFSEEKKQHEESLQANAMYTCPHCLKKGEQSVPFKRKTIAGVQTLRVICEFCKGNIDITKKMKEPKKKK